jgi:hypothetical protein
MTKAHQLALKETLKNQMSVVEQLEKEGQSQAYIIGYMTGLLKQTIRELEW